MKKRLTVILLFLLLLAVVPVMLLITELKTPKLYSDSYYAELPVLYEKLEETDGRKIVLIGGSNIAFGTDAALLKETLAAKGYDYEVRPFGLYAAIGTSAMLDLSLDTLKEGDIVILSPEPMSEAMSTYFGATAFLKSVEDRPGLVTRLHKERLASVFGNYTDYLQERVEIVNSGNYPQATGVYSKAAFDNQGTMTYPREGNIMTIGYDVSSPIDLSGLSITDDFSREVNEYIKKATSRGACVYYSFCPLNRSAVTDSSMEVMDSYFELVQKSFNCRIISDPNNYLYDSGWFYDSNFHLNTAGAELRTIQLAKDLLAELGCYEVLDIPLPIKPDSMAQTIAEQNTVEHTTEEGPDRFVFEESFGGTGLVLTGLTTEGETATSLTIPGYYRGKPVMAVSPDALAAAEALEELRIPSTISELPDNLFTNCPSITRVILEHTDSPCGLSEHSMDNSENVRFFVPETSFTLYRDGYGCEANPWTPYLDQIYSY